MEPEADPSELHSFPTRRSSDLTAVADITLAFTAASSINNTAPKQGDTLTAVNGTLNDSDASVTGYQWQELDRRSTRLNSSHADGPYAVVESDEPTSPRGPPRAT